MGTKRRSINQRAKIEYEPDGIDRKIALAKVGCKTTEEEAIAEADVMLEEGEMDPSTT